jgi:hypothetical protein
MVNEYPYKALLAQTQPACECFGEIEFSLSLGGGFFE